jgi:aspartyl-tRNA(Asn)/glutamyl-tRNA(Gln) amidotransferase subunit C
MSVEKDEVRKIARLARLALKPEEVTQFQADLSQILNYVAKIQSVDTKDVPAQLHPESAESVLREDQVQPCLPREEALQNAPDTDGVCFRVPPVLPGGES